jgi:hypothetical protein
MKHENPKLYFQKIEESRIDYINKIKETNPEKYEQLKLKESNIKANQELEMNNLKVEWFNYCYLNKKNNYYNSDDSDDSNDSNIKIRKSTFIFNNPETKLIKYFGKEILDEKKEWIKNKIDQIKKN